MNSSVTSATTDSILLNRLVAAELARLAERDQTFITGHTFFVTLPATSH